MESTLSAFFDGIPESPVSPCVFVIGIVVLIEPLPAVFGPPQRIRTKFGDYVSPWLMPVQLVAVD
jgi:hypothetical protein